MKLAIGILLVLFANSALAESLLSVLAAGDLNDVIRHVNMHREHFALRFNISNMRVMNWDDKLVKEIEKLPTDLSSFKSNYRYQPVNGSRLFSKMTIAKMAHRLDPRMPLHKIKAFIYKNYERILDNMDKMGKMATLLVVESTHPMQTRIGCDLNFKAVDNEDPDLYIQGICLFGPEKTFEKKHIKRGYGGSECGGLPKYKDGLCGVVRPVHF